MSIHMPTLFDDEEYFVPPPKKESRKKKEDAEAKDEVLKDAAPDAAADLVVSEQPLTEPGAQPVEAIDASDAIAATTAAEQPVEGLVTETPADQVQPEPDIASAEAITEVAAEEGTVVPVTPAEDETPEADVAINIPAEITEVVLTESAAEPEVTEEPTAEVIEATDTELETVGTNVAADTPAAITEVVVTDAAPESEVTEEPALAEETQETTVVAPQVPVIEEAGPEASEAEELTEAPEEEVSEAPEMATEQFVELEQVDNHEAPDIAAGLQPEIIEVSAVDELTVELPKATPGITFEIPEEDETPAIELEMTARPIPAVREDKVDDLDQLMRTELISQDYTAFSGFAFEPQPEKKKIIPEPEAEISAGEPAIAPGKEDISLAVQEIDAAALDFEFESNALASSLPEFDLENKYYTIGEVAALFGVNVSHIRFWTTEFNLKVRTTRKGDRLYNPENIARLRLIHHLVKENGFTIKGAKDKLKHQKQNVSSQIDLKNKLNGLKDKLERIKKNL